MRTFFKTYDTMHIMEEMEKKEKIRIGLKITEAAQEEINAIMIQKKAKRVGYDIDMFEHNFLVLRFWDQLEGGDVRCFIPLRLDFKEFSKLLLDYNNETFSVSKID